MKKFSSILILSLIQAAICLGQTDMANSQYIFEKTFVTPANFDQSEKARVFMNYQSGGGGDRGGKEYILSLAGNYKINEEKSLIGVNVVNSRFGQETSLLGYVNYTYNLKMTENSYLSNGFGFGVQQYRLNLMDGQGVNPIDPTITGNIYSSKFDFRIGTTAVINKRSFVGISFDNVLSKYNNQSEKEVNYLPANFRRINMSVLAGSKNRLDDVFDLNYMGIYNYNFGGLSIIDANVGVDVAKVIGVGLAYRRYIRSEDQRTVSNGVVRPYLTLNLVKNNNNIKFNYAYGFSPNKVNMVGATTHDFGLMYIFK